MSVEHVQRYLDQHINNLRDNESLVEQVLRNTVRMYGEKFGVPTKDDIRVTATRGEGAFEDSIKLELACKLPKYEYPPTAASFWLMRYPACCAMKQVNHFICPLDFTDASLEAFMDFTLDAVNRSEEMDVRRLVFNFVQSNTMGLSESDILQDVDPGENPNMRYPQYYNWARKQAKYSEMCFMNANSGNIIHFAEVIPSAVYSD